MSGGDMTLEDCAFSQVMQAKGKLREWIANIVNSCDLLERDGEEEIATEPPQDVAIENYEPALESLVAEEEVEEVEEAPSFENDGTLDDALLRARAYL